MAIKIKYQARFKDGATLSRNSARSYSHAWRFVWNGVSGKQHEVSGFSRTATLAQAEVTKYQNAFNKPAGTGLMDAGPGAVVVLAGIAEAEVMKVRG